MQRNRESNLESNAAARAKLAARGKPPDLVIPEEVVEWFDRTRVAYLFALEQKQGKAKNASAETAAHVSYVKQKFERRGQLLWSVFHKVLEAAPGDSYRYDKKNDGGGGQSALCTGRHSRRAPPVP